MAEENNGRRQTIKIPTPFGPIEIRGISSVLALIFGVVLVSAYMLYDHSKDTAERRATNISEHKTLADQSRVIENRLDEMVYVTVVCARSKEECQKLDLDVPERLKRRTRDR